MKSFIAALILLAVIVSAVFVNALYCGNLYSEISNALLQFPESAVDVENEIMTRTRNTFDRHLCYFGFILPKSDILELACDISDIFSFHAAKDTASYLASLERAKNRLDQMQKGERIGFSEIFGS